MLKIRSVKAWFNRARHWDTLVAYTSGGFGALRRILREIATFRLPEKPARKRQYHPAVSTLEQRESPTSLLTSPASVLGTSAFASAWASSDASHSQADNTTTTYWADGRVKEVIDPAGIVTDKAYDQLVRNPDGTFTNWAWE